MPVPISNVTRRAVYSPTGTGGAGPYAFTFEILANTDIAVFKDEVLLTLTTHYTVVINANGTGTVTITATGLALSPTSPTQYAIVGNRTIARSTDFTTGGDFFANTLNDELDQQTIFAQQNAEGLVRALSAPQTDPTSINMTLPLASLRANKTLGFDANGNPALGETLGTNRGNWASGTIYFVRDIVKDTTTNNIFQVITAHTSSGSLPITTNADSAKWTLLVDAASATTSATNAAASASAASTSASNASTSASNASTSASNASSSASAASTSASNAATAQTAAEAARDSALAAYDNFDDRYLGPKASNPTVDNDGNALLAGALYYNTVVPEMRLYTGSAWVAAYVSGAAYLLTANNLSELTASASTARTNLGLGTASTMTGPSGTIVGTTDTQTLTNKTLTTPVISSISNTGTVTLPTSTDTLVGRATTDTLTNKTLTNPTVTNYVESVVAIGNSGTSQTLALTNGTVQTVTMTGNCTFTMPTATAGKSFILIAVQDGTGSRTATFTSVKFAGGVAPTLTTTATTGRDILTFVADGTNWYGTYAQAFA
jgi:hypothetical protein